MGWWKKAEEKYEKSVEGLTIEKELKALREDYIWFDRQHGYTREYLEEFKTGMLKLQSDYNILLDKFELLLRLWDKLPRYAIGKGRGPNEEECSCERKTDKA